ncbi:MAG: ExeM/NucH family extracellular endonuclease, partial [Nostocales cyanobacterium 94392]|nr:ExeM/NucH family extracellular endonuclease [Nostocales cyanobacterium 94392]
MSTTIWQESFETDGQGTRYTASNTFNDGSNDHFQRTDGSNISNISNPYSNYNGTFFWAGEDLDDNGGDGLANKTITFQAVNTSSFSNLEFKGLFGVGNEKGAGSSAYDATDFAKVFYSIDGGTNFTEALRFSYVNSGDAFNEPLAQDTNFDGNGDGTVLTTAMQEFSFNIPNASNVTIKIEARFDAGDEEFGFDNFQLAGDAITTTPIVSITASDANAAEAGTDTGTFTISRTGDTDSALNVSYNIAGTATNGTDYTSLTSPVTIPAGESSVDITITPVVDSDVEGNETVTLTLSDTADYDLGANTSATVTIADDDIVPSTAEKLLLTEIVVTPTGGEFIEIYNPGSTTVDLSDYYLTDATFAGGNQYYYNIVTGSGAGGGGFTDFHARFPDAATIGAGEYQTIALNGSNNFFSEYGVNPTYELYEDAASADAIADMREATAGSINNQGGLTNDGEFTVLYHWDGSSDLVTDVDYVVWGDKAEAVDKSGVSIDGPDGDTTNSTYQNDTAITSQAVINIGAHGSGESFQRSDLNEGTQTTTGGNGVDGRDETSENLSNTWATSTTTPNAAYNPVPNAGNKAIYEIQGSGTASTFDGQVVTTTGIVVGDFQESDELRGFFIQDQNGDSDTLTSDGIFVYDPGKTLEVQEGDLVEVTGEVDEFNTFTEIKNVTNISVISSENALPTAGQVTLPETTNNDLERYEGMLVEITNPMTVSQNFFLGRYGQMTLSSPDDNSNAGRLYNPTNLFRPGTIEAIDLANENARRILILDDGQDINSLGDNPSPVPYLGSPPPNVIRAGDTVTNLKGVLDYGRINSSSNPNRDYRLHPTEAPTFTEGNPRPVTPEDVGGTLKVASFNVLNYFTTLNQGSNTTGPNNNLDPRGADSASEFTRQEDKIVEALQILDADIFGLVELENNQTQSLQSLVDALNSEIQTDTGTAGTYDFVNTGFIGTDAIKVGFIYDTSTVDLVGNHEILDDTDNPNFSDNFNRPALAQTFQEKASGEKFTAVVNHFKSKGSLTGIPADQDQGDGQGNNNFTRSQAAEVLVDWLATDPTTSGDDDFLILGDLNAYAEEDPIIAIEEGADDTLGTADDFTNLIEQFKGTDAYSYIFDGEAGYLDHALANASLTSQVTGITEWHINTDEPQVIDYDENFNPPGYYSANQYRSSDHDPVLIGLNLGAVNNTIGETGTISNLTHAARTINLSRNYQNPVIFAQPLSFNGTAPATVRLDDITSNSFTV